MGHVIIDGIIDTEGTKGFGSEEEGAKIDPNTVSYSESKFEFYRVVELGRDVWMC